jgi:hypothetical protein
MKPKNEVHEFDEYFWMGFAGATRFPNGEVPLYAFVELGNESVGKYEILILLCGEGCEIQLDDQNSADIGENNYIHVDVKFPTGHLAKLWLEGMIARITNPLKPCGIEDVRAIFLR